VYDFDLYGLVRCVSLSLVYHLDFVRDSLLEARGNLEDCMVYIEDGDLRYERLSEAIDVALAQVSLLSGVNVVKSVKYPLESFESGD